jgi:sugar fermentation stimulation protein A
LRREGLAEFPDCTAARSARHMEELAQMTRDGFRAALVFVIQMQADRFDVAADIDPAYARAYRAAREAGVSVHAYTCRVTRDEIVIAGEVPVND